MKRHYFMLFVILSMIFTILYNMISMIISSGSNLADKMVYFLIFSILLGINIIFIHMEMDWIKEK
jgi:hypothetical protein